MTIETVKKRNASLLIDKGAYAEALVLLDGCLAEDNEDADVWCLVGKARGRLGESEASLQAYKKSVSLHPGDPENLASLAWGSLYHGTLDEALDVFTVLAACPVVEKISGYWRIGRGIALARHGANEAAMVEFLLAARKSIHHAPRAWREAKQIAPEHAVTKQLEGLKDVSECVGQSRFDRAAEMLEEMIANDPTDDFAWEQLGFMRDQLMQPEPAFAAYRKGVALAPDNPERLTSLARGMYRQASAVDALGVYERIAGHPAVTHLDSGWLLDRGRAEYAAGLHEKAIQSYVSAARDVSVYMPEEGLTAILRQAIFVEWDTPGTQEILHMVKSSGVSGEALFSAVLAMPQYFMSAEEEERCLRNIAAALTWLEKQNDVTITNPLSLNHLYILGQLLYNVEVTPLRKRITNAIISHTAGRHDVPAPVVRKKGKRLRLGIALMRASEKNNVNTKGMIPFFQHIDRDKFEVILFYPDKHLGIESPGVASFLLESVDKAVEYPTHDWSQFQNVFIRENLDILLHENWGSVLFCGYFRCATIQCNFYDPMQIMGSPQEDYCIWVHCRNDRECYFGHTPEKFAVMPDLFNWGIQNSIASAPVTYEELGLPEAAPFLFSWQNNGLWRHEDDALLEAVAQRNPEAWFVFANAGGGMAELMRRWRMTIPRILDRVRVIPFQSYPRLLGIIKLAGAILVPPLTSGSLSIGTAFSQGVHYPYFYDKKLSNNGVTLAYDKIGLDSLATADLDRYLDTIEFLITNPEWRKSQAGMIMERLPRLFDISKAVRELQEFLVAAHERMTRGLPPEHWIDSRFVVSGEMENGDE